MTVWDGSQVEYSETTTLDIGDTSGLVLSVDILGGNVRLLANSNSTGFTVKVLAKIM